MRVTSIEKLPRQKRYEVRVDHVLVVPLSAEVLAASGLKTGDEVANDRLRTLEQQEARHTATAYALRLLAYRPRSERELGERLLKHGASPAVCDETIARLRDLSLVDDAAFARFWVDSRDRMSPRGRRLLVRELRTRRADQASVQAAVATVDEEDAAYRAGARRTRSLAGGEWQDFQRRLGDHLLRRGFGYDIARRTVARLWQETRGEAAPMADPETGQ